MNRTHHPLSTLLFLALGFEFLGALAGAPPAQAADTRVYRITNNTGQRASDLHIVFRFTGGDLTTAVLVNPPGCPAPAIPSNGPGATRTMVLDWGVECVAPGDRVTVRVSTINGPLAPDSGFWTNLANPVPPGYAPLDPEEDIEELDGPPGGDWAFPFPWWDWCLLAILIVVCWLLWKWKKGGKGRSG